MTDGGSITSDQQGVADSGQEAPLKNTAGYQRKNFFGMVNPLDLAGIIGFGLYLGEFYLIMSCRVVPNPLSVEGDTRYLVFSFLFGEMIISALLVAIARYLINPRAAKVAVFVAGAAFALPGLMSFFPTPFFVCLLAWFFAGLGAVCLLALWGYFLAQLNQAKSINYATGSVLLAGVCLLVVSMLFKVDAWPFANIMLPLTSAALFFVWAKISFKEEEFPVFENVRPYDAGSLLHSAAAMVANSFLLGFGFCVVASQNSTWSTLVIVVAIIVAALYKFVDTAGGVKYQVGTIITVIAPVAAIELLLAPYVSEMVALVIFGLAMLLAMINEIICWSAVACYMHVYQVHPFANAGFGRFGDVLGLAFGFCYGIFMMNAPYDDFASGLIRGVVVVLFVGVQAFFFQDNYRPFTEHASMKEELSEGTDDQEERHIGAWSQNINDFARHYELTARQTEVLLLLAKGYSTSKIEETLVVSNHTVKAHVYSIYQKTDVHSRQELIELIEKFSDSPVER